VGDNLRLLELSRIAEELNAVNVTRKGKSSGSRRQVGVVEINGAGTSTGGFA
jgi:hypothetical protein